MKVQLPEPSILGGPGVPVESPLYGNVHSWDVSIGVDGPGTRFALFTAGCPLRCLYCENPDTWTAGGGRRTSVGEVMTRIRRYTPILKAGGGGVTLSGGEPLVQPRFTAAVLNACQEIGLHTALDTSGYLGRLATDAMLADVDLVLLDIKSFQPELYRRITGHELAPTLRFAERLAELGRPVWVRFVMVPGLTDAPENVDGLAGFVAGLPNVERVDVLGYHRLGAPKYEALGLRYPLADVPEPDAEQLAAVRRRFSDRGLVVT
jgi:pyruvate formate lyase activating enzyme